MYHSYFGVNLMQTFTSREVQTQFGMVLDFAKRAPITVTQYGRPSFMMVPLDIGQEAVRISNAARFADFLDAMPAPNSAAPALSLEDVNRLVHEVRP
jgi:antitoxin (DNA-binding transcriptional repressor) of toxin-antitoxin stability system